jgi:hypothetical protein
MERNHDKAHSDVLFSCACFHLFSFSLCRSKLQFSWNAENAENLMFSADMKMKIQQEDAIRKEEVHRVH